MSDQTQVASSLADQFLIAMPALQDPNFSRTVTYLCQHSDEGAMGLVINRPMEIHLGDVLEQMDIQANDPECARQTVFLGGPVQPERGFVLHSPPGNWDSSFTISTQLAVATSMDILKAIADGQGPQQYLITLGYAGWGAGQLESELIENTWLNGPACHEILFESQIQQRWERAAACVGVDLNLLSGETGHG